MESEFFALLQLRFARSVAAFNLRHVWERWLG